MRSRSRSRSFTQPVTAHRTRVQILFLFQYIWCVYGRRKKNVIYSRTKMELYILLARCWETFREVDTILLLHTAISSYRKIGNAESSSNIANTVTRRAQMRRWQSESERVDEKCLYHFLKSQKNDRNEKQLRYLNLRQHRFLEPSQRITFSFDSGKKYTLYRRHDAFFCYQKISSLSESTQCMRWKLLCVLGLSFITLKTVCVCTDILLLNN